MEKKRNQRRIEKKCSVNPSSDVKITGEVKRNTTRELYPVVQRSPEMRGGREESGEEEDDGAPLSDSLLMD